DWIVGLNFTRAYTTLNHQLCTVGRVQTPTLGLIVERQEEINNFIPVEFFEVLVTFEPGFIARYLTPQIVPQTRLANRATAERIIKSISTQRSGKVEKLETVERRSKAPGLYDLLTLQKEANKQFGYTAQETLDIAQSLYEEHKLLSYPRTESRHLSTDMVEELPRILSNLLQSTMMNTGVAQAFAKEGILAGNISADLLRRSLSKSYVDDTKLTDHHAIIPTHNAPPAALPEKQRNVYLLVATRFLSIFLPAEVREETEILIKIGIHLFRAKGVVVRDAGWTVVESGKEKFQDRDQEAQQMPPMSPGDLVNKRKAELKEGKTTPPKAYDDSSLLTAMKNAGKELDDDDLASYMAQSGLGTPATRAAIIERLVHSDYVVRSKKSLLPTDKGKALINAVHPSLKDIALTASWEQKLAEVTEGKLALAAFEADIARFLTELLPEVSQKGASLPVVVDPGLGKCPKCKDGTVRETPQGAGCSRWKEGCNFSVWREQYGKKITDSQLKELIEKGRTKVIKGFKKKDGSGSYDARLVLNNEFKVRLEFEKQH
ncbi:MAG: topoisomerase C-terminal repeat-containing protein, partial [Candidatus Obscuribacterales bacterium]|nr:topoisomerase C-terminal repeat-containing protein [Candidatus Obscuribacterales bacterium]